VSKLRVHNFVVTLDGYATSDDQSTKAAASVHAGVSRRARL